MRNLLLRYPSQASIAAAVLFIIAVVAPCTRAQLGRGPKRDESPTPKPTPVPSAKPSNRDKSARPTLIVTKLVQSPSLTIETRIAFEGFVQRLSESRDVDVRSVATDVSRGEAVKRAKAERDAYVVWLRTEVDVPDTETASIATINPGCVLIAYTVYSPQSARIKTEGRTSQRDYVPAGCVASASHPAPQPSERYPHELPYEERLKRAAHEAANRVLRAFNLPVPTTDP